jgi:hypothetical protein
MPAEKILSELLELIKSEICSSKGETLTDKEDRALAIGRQAASMALSEMLRKEEDEPVVIPCMCGSHAKSKERESRIIVTLCGTQKISRRRYRCPSCGRWIVPLDKVLGIGKGNYSAGVVALSSEVAAGFTFEASEGFLARRFGLDLCYKQVQRISERTGDILAKEEWEQARQVISGMVSISADEKPQRLSISCDGLMVNVDGSYSEMKVGTFINECGRSTIASMERAEGFGELLFLESIRRGSLSADEIIFVADGAAWIWNVASHHFPDCVEIVDWYHATQHLWEVANSWYGEGKKKARVWVEKNKARLMEDGVERVISSIKQWQPSDEDGQKVKRENLHYFSTNTNRMLYATFLLNDYYIGSGSVESACKQYGVGRLKQSGMRWKSKGIEAIAHLRSVLLNGRTDNILEAARKAA